MAASHVKHRCLPGGRALTRLFIAACAAGTANNTVASTPNRNSQRRSIVTSMLAYARAANRATKLFATHQILPSGRLPSNGVLLHCVSGRSPAFVLDHEQTVCPTPRYLTE